VKKLRVGVTDGKQIRSVFWVNVGDRDIYCGMRGVPYHGTYHDSGEIHMAKQAPPNEEPPGASFICYHGKSSPFRVKSPSQLGGGELLGATVIPNNEASLKDFEVMGGKKYDGIVYVDARLFRGAIVIRAWASRPDYFFQPMPKPPGFRSIFDLPLCWVVIDVEST